MNTLRPTAAPSRPRSLPPYARMLAWYLIECEAGFWAHFVAAAVLLTGEKN